LSLCPGCDQSDADPGNRQNLKGFTFCCFHCASEVRFELNNWFFIKIRIY
jgi:hypothetical protein